MSYDFNMITFKVRALAMLIAGSSLLGSACTPPDSRETSPAEITPQGDDMPDPTTAGDPLVDPPGFRALFEGYINPQCAQEACHGGPRGIAGLRLVELEEAYTQLIDQPPTNAPSSEMGLRRVTPGAPEMSLLWRKLIDPESILNAQGWGAAMPMSGGLAPGEQTRAAILAWIEGGAPLEGSTPMMLDAQAPTIGEQYVTCEAEGVEEMRRCFAPPEDGANTLRLFTPPLIIPPGEELLICSYLEMPIDRPLWINRTLGQQMTGGHHSAVFLAVSPSDEPPHPCRDDEMENFRFAAGAGGGGGQDTQLPEGIALEISPGQQFVIQSHYLNPTDRALTVMDAVDLVLIDPSEVSQRVDPFALIAGDFEIPPESVGYEVIKTCRVDTPLDIYMLLGHTHDHGVLFEFTHRLADGGERTLYRATDGPLLRDNPEIKYFDPPLKFEVGDEVEMRCVWDNSTDSALGWPEEMCVGLMYYGPGRGWLTCGSGDETPQGGEQDDEGGCVEADAQGNALGVGEACTASGGECANNEQAKMCLVAFDPRANFCSFLGCDADEECGAGAACVAQGPTSACVPVECAGDED